MGRINWRFIDELSGPAIELGRFGVVPVMLSERHRGMVRRGRDIGYPRGLP